MGRSDRSFVSRLKRRISMETMRMGSTRMMMPVSPGVIEVRYTDRWSAFDRGSSPQEIHGIGAARCACAVRSFQLARVAGHLTHFLRQVDPLTMQVKEFSVPGRESLSGKVHGRVLPIEWVWRAYAFGSLLERLKRGEITPAALGFPQGTVVTEGMKLPRLRRECTTKFETTDRHLTDAEAMQIAGLDRSQWEEAWRIIGDVVDAVSKDYEECGFFCPDGKLELGMTDGGRIVLVDVFGTQDENRIIRKNSGDIYSKDLIRQYLKGTPWYAELQKAKREYPDKSQWPPYPRLSDDLVRLVSERYALVAQEYAGVSIH
jgi:phosphoribosylaminoimidazole-succinocarboxamide synthase